MAIPTFTAGISPSIVDLVGDTPLIRLRRIERDLPGVELYAKAEWKNPGGSVKDRPALRMIQEGIASGQLSTGKVILDATSGNTGIAYAMMGAAMGYSVTLSVPENVTPETQAHPARLRRGAGLHQSARGIRRRDPHGAADERRESRESTSTRISTTTISTGDRITTRPGRRSSARPARG